MLKKPASIVGSVFFFSLLASAALSQQAQKLSIEQIEVLLKEGVSQGRIALLVGERGVNFELNEQTVKRLKSVGADAFLIRALEKVTSSYTSDRLEKEAKKLEQERERVDAERKVMQEEKIRIEEERQKLDEEKRKVEEERRRLEQARKPLSVAEIEGLLRDRVSAGRVAEIIEKERGIDFEVTGEVRERLKKVGADSKVLQAIETAGMKVTGRVWAVQVNAFPNERDATNLTNKLTDKGYDAYVVPTSVKGKTWYRVRVGRLATREEAEQLEEILKTKEKFSNTITVSR